MIQALDPYGLVARGRLAGVPEEVLRRLAFHSPSMGAMTKNTPGDMPGTMAGINMPPVTPIEDIMKLLEPTSMASMASPEAAVPMPSYEVPSWLSGMEPNTRQQLMYGYTSPMYGGYDKILEYGRTPGMELGMGYGKTPGNVCPYCGKSY